MIKPEMQTSRYYTYQDIIHYVEYKYNINTRNYKFDVDQIRRDFWHYVLYLNDRNVHKDGCFIYLIPEDYYNEHQHLENKESDYIGDKTRINYEEMDYNEPPPTWVREILNLILLEFPDLRNSSDESLENFKRVWVEW